MQQVRVGSHKSSWKFLSKGVPQASILGPLPFNIFINDIFYFILYNYTDDNTLSYIHKDLESLKSVLEEESIILIKWFEENYMQANPDKFQAICVGKNLFVLRFYGPVNPMGSCRARSVYLTTRLLGRLSPLSG